MRTHGLNWFGTTLTSQVGPEAVNADVESTGGLTSPGYIVINPRSSTQREVWLADGTFTSTRFSVTTLDNRYLDGSAAGSGLTHDAGSEVWSVPVAQNLDDLWDELDAVYNARYQPIGVAQVASGTESSLQLAIPSGMTTVRVVGYIQDSNDNDAQRLLLSLGGVTATDSYRLSRGAQDFSGSNGWRIPYPPGFHHPSFSGVIIAAGGRWGLNCTVGGTNTSIGSDQYVGAGTVPGSGVATAVNLSIEDAGVNFAAGTRFELWPA